MSLIRGTWYGAGREESRVMSPLCGRECDQKWTRVKSFIQALNWIVVRFVFRRASRCLRRRFVWLAPEKKTENAINKNISFQPQIIWWNKVSAHETRMATKVHKHFLFFVMCFSSRRRPFLSSFSSLMRHPYRQLLRALRPSPRRERDEVKVLALVFAALW